MSLQNSIKSHSLQQIAGAHHVVDISEFKLFATALPVIIDNSCQDIFHHELLYKTI